MKSRQINTCMNCGSSLPDPPHVFQGVLICSDCFKIVSHCIQKTKAELNMLYTVYTDMLRVALVKGELRPPPAAPDNKEMPPLEFTKAFQRLSQKYGGLHGNETTGTDGQDKVPALRDDEHDTDGAVDDWRHTEALSGRR